MFLFKKISKKEKQEETELYVELADTIPVEIFHNLRFHSNRPKKSDFAVEVGLRNSLCNVVVKEKRNENIVGMARLVGDGGIFCAIVGVRVLPVYEKNKKVETMLMKKMMEYIEHNIPKTCFITVVVSKKKSVFYKKFGFMENSTLNRIGMFYNK
eukprot:TCONS_00011724-protein